MNLPGSVVSHLLFPLQEMAKGHSTLSVHRQLDSSQWLSLPEIEELQMNSLRHFLVDIGENVKYYEDLFYKLEFRPDSISAIADLQKLPLLDKAAIRANTGQMKAKSAGKLARFNTGGSTGEPLIFYLGNRRVSHDVAAKRRATRWWGVDIGDPEIVVWGSPIELGSQDRIRQIRDFLFNTKLLSAFEMSSERLDGFVQTIKSDKPRMLFGYPSSLAHIAEHAQSSGVRLDNLGIKVAFVTSERLYEHQRAKIERIFGCPVANGYGGRDSGFIAHQCPAGSMHITAEDIVVEIIRPDGSIADPGESGEIVVTHLRTNEFPFVRYRTGDVGALTGAPCECGRGLPVLCDLQGRTTDFVVARDGTVMHGLALIYILRDLEGVSEFKIVQESLDRTVVFVVPDDAWDAALGEQIEEGFRARLGKSVVIDIRLVDDIPAEASGKRRYVVSNVEVAPEH